MRSLTSAASLALLLGLGSIGAATPASSQAYVGADISVGFAPPPLPIYDQPPIPGYGYIWSPGYWAWDDYDGDYYWVPGTWVLPPRVGFLWTPPWWGWDDGYYVFHTGYWGPHIGYYGGINYGYGYTSHGYYGGEWRGNRFFYNGAVNNVRNVNVSNVFYNRNVSNTYGGNRVSYNGPGGVQARPTPQQLSALREPHLNPTALQMQHIQAARALPNLRASVNRGAPGVGATMRPGAFSGPAVVAARPGGVYRAPIAAQGGRPAGFGSRPVSPGAQAGGYRPGEPVYRPRVEGAPAGERPQYRPAGPQIRQSAPEGYRPSPGSYRQPQEGGGYQPSPGYAQPRPEGYRGQGGGYHPGPGYGQPHPQPQMARPAFQAPHPQPMPQARPMPQGRPGPAPQARPAPAPHPEGHGGGRPDHP